MIIARIAGATGASGVAAAFGALFKLLTDPDTLLELFNAVTIHTNPNNVLGRFAAAMIGLAISGIVTVVAALLHPSPIQKG